MPSSEEEFDAVVGPAEDEFDKLVGGGAPETAATAPVELPPVEVTAEKTETDRPWYDSGVFAGARRGIYGNLGNKLADKLLSQRDDGNTYAGSTPGESLEGNFQAEAEAHPWKVGAGQIASSIAPAYLMGVAGGSLGGAGGRAAGEALGRSGLLGAVAAPVAGHLGAGAGAAVGAGLGSGIVPFAANTFAEQEGDVGERAAGTQQFMEDHPVATTLAAGLPFAAEAAAPVVKAVGTKLVDAGNRGLARIGLGPAELARLRAIGGESKLAQVGQKMRNAGLDKGRDLWQKLTPTDAKRIADNAAAVTETQGPRIAALEDEILQTPAGEYPGTAEPMSFGQTEADVSALPAQLRSQTRVNSGETNTPKIAKAMEKQARRFESPSEDVRVPGTFQEPPPLPNYTRPELPPDYTAPIPQQTELPLPPPAPKASPPAPPQPVQGRLDLAQQQSLPLPEPTVAPAPQYSMQPELNLETQMPLPAMPKPAWPEGAPVATLPVPRQGGLPLETQLSLPTPPAGGAATTAEKLQSAYDAVRAQIGRDHVAISDLLAKSGVPREEAHALLLEQPRNWRRGEFTAATPEQQAAAVPLDDGGTSHIYVALNEGRLTPSVSAPSTSVPLPNAPVPPPPVGTQLPIDFPPQPMPGGGPLPTRQPNLPLESQMSLPKPAPEPYVSGPLPEQQMNLSGLGGSQQSLPLPPAEPLSPWTPPTPPAAAQAGLDLSTQMPMDLPPGGHVTRGEFPAGGTTKTLEAAGKISDPYTVQRMILDKRDIAKELFKKKQKALQTARPGEEEARDISWHFLKDRFQQELDKGVEGGVLSKPKVDDYRKASADFNIAADVQVDTARKAEQELSRAAGVKGFVKATGDTAPGTKYNLGRLLQGLGSEPVKKVGRGLAAPVLSPEQRNKAETKANDDMKTNMFKAWYNKMSGSPQ